MSPYRFRCIFPNSEVFSRGSGKLRRRPSLPGSAKVVRLKESVYQQRRKRKTSTGFSNSTDTVLAEIVLHSLPNENRRNVNLPQNNSSYGLAPK